MKLNTEQAGLVTSAARSILSTLSDMSNSPSNSSASSNSNSLPVPVIITIVVLCGIVQIVVVILIIRCVQKIRSSSTNSRVMTPCGSTPSSMFKESRIEMEPMEEFLYNILKDKPMRFTPQNLVDFTQNYAEKLGSGDFLPKVADFGLAKLCDRKKTTKPTGGGGGRGTPGYAAPEMWLPLPVTHKCDVYSYGMLLLETLGKRRNYDLKQVESREWFPIWVWRKYEQGELESMISACGIEEEDRENAERMCQVALWCIQYQPESRPDMNCVVKMLEGKQQIPAADNPFEHMMNTDSSSSALWSSITSTTYSSSRETGKDGTELCNLVSPRTLLCLLACTSLSSSSTSLPVCPLSCAMSQSKDSNSRLQDSPVRRRSIELAFLSKTMKSTSWSIPAAEQLTNGTATPLRSSLP
ncbi:hypothetical protein OPV22_012930 [Ensete ventricosum]|uniref:Protein kinase domain-containing protein n=1 Tax=Ensete ventricosum TaxID=4639 RepID=A0AAV8PM11_ENSVE|nr:hypothetical protein OPV22_012930 [Ensete ventricosum]